MKAYLTKPVIMGQEEIDFDLVQIGTESKRSIKIINPSDEPLIVQLFLTTDELFKQI